MVKTAPDILVIGSLNTDLVTRTKTVPNSGETILATSFTTGCGGKGLNQAVACVRTSRSREGAPAKGDIKVSMIGAIGEDLYGDMLRKELEANFIDDSHLQICTGSSGIAVIIVDETSGDNRILVTAGANHKVHLRQLAELAQSPVTRPSVIVLQLEIPISLVMEAIDIAKASKIAVVLNPAPAAEFPLDTFKGLDHLIMNMGEAKQLAQSASEGDSTVINSLTQIFQQFWDLGVQNTIVTLGEAGVAYSTGRGDFAQIAAEGNIKVVDTTGAGDTFVGSYAASLARMKAAAERFDVRKAVQRANQAAARTVQKEGAIASIPWADELPE